MDQPNPTNDDEEFFDASDDFPFFDCTSTDKTNQSTSVSSTRRRPVYRRRRVADDCESSFANITYKAYQKLIEKEAAGTGQRDNGSNQDSTVTTENDVQVGDLVASADSQGESIESSSLLVSVAGLVIKAIGFQLNLLISCFLFPLRVFFYTYMIIVDPFRTIRLGREFLFSKLYKVGNLIYELVNPLVFGWFKEHESIWKLVFWLGKCLFWAIYVGIILCGILIFSFMVSGLFMSYVVEKPIRVKQILNFDYTKSTPVTFVPLMSCYGASCCEKCEENTESSMSSQTRVIPVGHKLQATVVLTLPESEYNRNLGVFQVRVDFLAANGKPLTSSSRPCMLGFRSDPIRYLLTFLKAAPIVTGYVTETQTMKVKINGFLEGNVPTSCLKVMIEQRAVFSPGSGIPQIYDSSLILESELPLFKRIIWYWRKLIFLWLTVTLLIMQLSFLLICCRPIILPNARFRAGSSRNRASPTS